MIGSLSPEYLRRHPRFLELAPQPVRLSGCVVVVRHMQNQKRWNPLVALDVPDGREVALAIGRAELLRMPELRVRLSEALARAAAVATCKGTSWYHRRRAYNP